MFCDFVVKHDWETETDEALTNKILYSIFIGRLKDNKPCNVGVFGSSGSGKSISGGIKLQEVLMRLQGINDITPYFDAMNVYIPTEYPSKLNGILFNDALKDINIFTIHESREIISSKSWQSFISQAVASINATSREIKRVMSIFVSQSMADITKDVRKTLDYRIIMRRPRGKRPRMQIKVLWSDERDPEKPVLKVRSLSGLVVDKYGRHRQFCPTYFEVAPPSKNLVEMFRKQDREAKSIIIKKKMDKMLSIMEKEMGLETDKVGLLVDHYTKNESMLMLLGKKNKNGWKINQDIKRLHDLSDNDFAILQKRVNEKINRIPVINEALFNQEVQL